MLILCSVTATFGLHLPSLPSLADAALSRRTALGLLAAAPLATHLQAALAEPAAALATTAAADPGATLCDTSVSCLRSARGQDITLVGTAHISEESAALVRRIVQQIQPDEVMIELDPSRAAKLIGTRPTLKLEAPAGVVIERPETAQQAAAKPAGSTFGIGSIAGRLLRGDIQEAGAQAVGAGLSSMYKQLDQMGFQSGAEFVAAVEEAERLGATVLLGDRDARVTVRRLRDALAEIATAPAGTYGASGTQVPQALLEATGGGASEFNRESVSSAMGVLKQRDNVRQLTAYLKAEVPPLHTALIAERDAYMAQSLLGASGSRIVAVVGLAHCDGIEAAILSEAGASVRPKPRVCAA